LAQLSVAGAGLIAGGVSGDIRGISIGAVGFHSITLDGQMLSKAGNFIVKGVGWATGLGALANDAYNIKSEYNK